MNATLLASAPAARELPLPLDGGRRLRIAQVAPLFESVPPRQYGGTERVVAYLCDALASLGHDVTLFASRDSTANVRLVGCCPAALRAAGSRCDPAIWSVLQIEAVLDAAEEFDVVHFHSGYLQFAIADRLPAHVTTLHGRLDLDPPELYARHAAPLVSISDAQRTPQRHASWVRTVHHGLPRDLLRPGPGDGGYLAFVGRLSAEKRVDRAIEIARRTGLPLKIIAKIDAADALYVEREVRAMLDAPGIEFLGEADERRKESVLAHAAALLFPIDWPEPFGLVMIEALACGTPVVAFANGSVPEIVEHGRTGFIVDSIDAAVAAVERIGEIDRAECRRAFLERFTAERMARDYLDVYREIVAARPDAQRTERQPWRPSVL